MTDAGARWGACAQVTQKDGFYSMHGTGLGVLEGLMGMGMPEGSDERSWMTFCPAGMRVDGYQVLQGPLLYQIRPRCSCYNCGAPAWLHPSAPSPWGPKAVSSPAVAVPREISSLRWNLARYDGGTQCSVGGGSRRVFERT